MALLSSVELTRVSSAAIPTGAKGQPGQSWWGPTPCFKRPEGTWRLLGLTSGGWGGDQRESLWQGQRGARVGQLEDMSTRHQAGNMGNQQAFTSGTEKPASAKSK